jgi:aminoglycoside phosphotransferase (APT) family kinase protein
MKNRTAVTTYSQDTLPFDLGVVRERLIAIGEMKPGAPLDARLVAGGRSNLTYGLDTSGRSWILRRPPLGAHLDTAHDMRREATVQRALSGTEVPVPRIVLSEHGTEAAHAGGSFYVMDRIAGDVLRTDGDFAAVSVDDRRLLSERYVDTLAALHTVQWAQVGLDDFGRPGNFAARQMRRWSGQLDATRGRSLPALDRLQMRLASSTPDTARTTIVHGDFRFDNMIVDRQTTSIVAVLDWEMSTLGDPLTDLGLVSLFWEGWSGIDNPIAGTPADHVGYPAFGDLAERYRTATGFDLVGFDWYQGFAFFKMAVILEGIHVRFERGDTVGDGFDTIGEMVEPLAERGLMATR